MLSVDVVTNVNDSGAGSLRNTIAEAAAGDTIIFAPSLYGQTIGLTSGIISVPNNLNIIGPGADNLTIQGGGFYVHAPGATEISGLTMTSGILPIENEGGNMTVADCIFTGNHVASVLLNASTGQLNIADCQITNNQGTAVVQGVINEDPSATTTITNTFISGNTSTVYRGSGIINDIGTVTVLDSQITDNVTPNSSNSGAIVNGNGFGSGTMFLIDSTVADNQAVGSFGGGIHNRAGATMTISGCTIDGNQAYIGGGIYNQGTMAITNSTIALNYASTDGGGIADYGNNDTSMTLVNCTVASNSTQSTGGGGITVAEPNFQMLNTLVANNTGYFGADDILGHVNSLGHNLVSNSANATGFVDSDLLDIDPMLGPLQDNGGPTLTMALLDGSPAIDAGDPNGAPATDQRGFARDASPDIGAFEYQYNPAADS